MPMSIFIITYSLTRSIHI